MFVHVYHWLISLDLLVHVYFKFSNSYQISPSKIIEVHDASVLSIIVIKHSSYEILIADGHIHEILSMPCSNATCYV